jgi:DNA polymerase
MKVSIDFETRSTVDLPKKGLDRYAKDPSTSVLCMAYCVEDNKAKIGLWIPGMALPPFMYDPKTEFHAWNAAFEYNICYNVLGLDHLRWEQFVDTMAAAAANNIPQSLEDAALFLGLEEQKDTAGKKLLQKLSKPQKDGKFNEDPELLRQLYDYCRQDVRTELAVSEHLRPLTPQEQRVWVLTQKINSFGVPVDPAELANAIRVVEHNHEDISKRIQALTGGITANQPAKLVQWLAAQGIVVEDMTAETVTKLLARNDLSANVRNVLSFRKAGSLTSVAKYEKMAEIHVGGWIRNTLVYHGASTGRFASRGGLNLQNIARPHYKDDEEHLLQEAIDRILVQGNLGTLEELSSLVRSAIKAPNGSVFVDADFSSIENRVASWIAGQDDKVEMFRQGLDEYKTFASSSLYRVPYEEVTKLMRQISKSAVLGCMFGQGPKGLVLYAEGLGVTLTLPQAEQAVAAYRQEYHKVQASWYAYADAAMEAIRVPGTAIRQGKVAFKVAKKALWMQLPSGRLICWQDPEVGPQQTPWGEMRDSITVRSQNTYTRKWGRNKLIGSSIFQSAVQATARDMLTESMLRLDGEGYDVINSIHDEVLLLVKKEDGESALKRVIDLMTVAPEWAPNFPLAAEGWVGERYRK